MTSVPKTWLITGASSGLGLEIGLAALAAGDKVILAARGVEQAAKDHPEVEGQGGVGLKLDVKSADTEHIVASVIKQTGGRLDVVVNNAGALLLTSLEDSKMKDVQEMVETHVYGAIRVMKGALPTFRTQKSGTVMNMSSFSGIVGHAGTGIYSLCKFALEGISEVWKSELAPFNIRVVILEPGAFRTQILKRATNSSADEIGSHYLDSAAGKTIKLSADMAQRPEELVAGDPAKLGQRVIDIVNMSNLGQGLEDVLRFPLGSDARNIIEGKIAKLLDDFAKTKAFAESANYEGHAGLGATGL